MADETKLITKPQVKIKVFGVGGGGNSVLMRMAKDETLGIDLIAVNTDARQLQQVAESSDIIRTVQIGEPFTHGRGTGGDIALGERAAKQDEVRLREAMNGADLVFITAGMGGGTGTGAAPVLAHIAKEMNVLSIGVVTVPFGFEGGRKQTLAKKGIARMQQDMDALITVQNDNLMKLPENRRMSLVSAFKAADRVLLQAISCVAELILTTGVINVDFADVTTIFRQSASSDALLGIGRSHSSALDALQQALSSPLVDKDVRRARGFILNLTGDETLSLFDVDEATRYIYENTDPQVNIILGTVIDNAMGGDIQATLIATDFTDGTPGGERIGKPAAQPQPQVQAQPQAQSAQNGQAPAPQQAPQPEQKPSFTLDTPSFMKPKPQPANTQHPAGPFAIPAFKLAPDHPERNNH